ncbi:hypothetical protein ACI6Q2_23415 [Chitinophagaceae bacterium LWZ2-11]
MKEQTNTNEILLETMIQKLETLTDKIEILKQGMDSKATAAVDSTQTKKDLDEIKTLLKNGSPPAKEIQMLLQKAMTNTASLKQSKENKTVHHHHLQKPVWVCAGLCIMLMSASVGWYSTYQKLDTYIANDTKYRSVKLIENAGLQWLLHKTDSLYRTNKSMRDSVIAQEEERQHSLEMIERKMKPIKQPTGLKSGIKEKHAR